MCIYCDKKPMAVEEIVVEDNKGVVFTVPVEADQGSQNYFSSFESGLPLRNPPLNVTGSAVIGTKYFIYVQGANQNA